MDFKDSIKDEKKEKEMIPNHPLNDIKKMKKKIENNLINDENFFLNFLHTLKKLNRSTSEISLISSLLKSLENFYKIIESAHINTDELIRKIASALKYIFVEANSMIFRTGDKGDKFYVILKGSINILIPQDVKLMMSEEEYIVYLAKLKVNNEIELFNRCMLNNKNIYPINPEFFEEENKMTIFKSKKGVIKKDTQIISHLKRFVEKYSSESINNQVVDLSEKYIKDLEPHYLNSLKIDKKEVTIWKYHNVLSLSSGEYFGEVALQSYLNKRTATVITVEDTHFGCIDKSDYDICLKQVADNQNKAYINMLLRHKIFEQMPYGLFSKKYFNMFVNNEVNIYETIFKENEQWNTIFFIRKGEFELSMKKSFNEINDFIKYLGGEKKHIKLDLKDTNERSKLKKFLNEKKLTKIAIIKSNDFLGLDDIIHQGKYVLTATSLLNKGEVMKIEKQFFDKIIEKENYLKQSVDNVINEKKRILIKRLRFILETRVALFLNKYKSKSIIDFNMNKKDRKIFDKIDLINPNYIIRSSRNSFLDIKKVASSSNLTNSIFMSSNINSLVQIASDRNDNHKIFKSGTTEFNSNFFLTTELISKSVDKTKPIESKLNTYRSRENDKITSTITTRRDNDSCIKPNNLKQITTNKKFIVRYNIDKNNNKKDAKIQTDIAFKLDFEKLNEYRSRNFSSDKQTISINDLTKSTNQKIKTNFLSNEELNLLSENCRNSGNIKGKKLKMKNIMKSIDYKKNIFQSVDKSSRFTNSMLFVRTNVCTNK